MTTHRPRRLRLLVAVVTGILLLTGSTLVAAASPESEQLHQGSGGPAADAEYPRQSVTTTSGPVVLIGHSYGGAVILRASSSAPAPDSAELTLRSGSRVHHRCTGDGEPAILPEAGGDSLVGPRRWVSRRILSVDERLSQTGSIWTVSPHRQP